MAEEKKKVICILIPCYSSVPSVFFSHMMEFITKNMGQYVLDIVVQSGQPTDKNRNELVQTALTKNPDYILWIDTDNLLPSGALSCLVKTLEDKKADLVTGIYFEKTKPHYPSIREYHSGGFWKLENPPLNDIFKIAGCGLGSCLMRLDVFKRIKYPWFKFSYEKWGYKDIQLSEDLYMCRQMIRKKMKLYCNSGIASDHIGSTTSVFDYMAMSEIRQSAKEDRDELISDIVKFTGQTDEKVNHKIMIGPQLMRDEWNRINPKTKEQRIKFYKETENYLYDLTMWHFTNRRQFDIELVTKLARGKKQPKNVLDFGCGIGQNSIMLAREGIDVTIADLDSKTLKFAEHRMKAHKVPYKIWKSDIEKAPPDKTYDIILMFDIIEHLSTEELKELIPKINRLKNKNTIVMPTISYGKCNAHPMHFNADKETADLVKDLLSMKT